MHLAYIGEKLEPRKFKKRQFQAGYGFQNHMHKPCVYARQQPINKITFRSDLESEREGAINSPFHIRAARLGFGMRAGFRENGCENLQELWP
jgi:hypothetical protein